MSLRDWLVCKVLKKRLFNKARRLGCDIDGDIVCFMGHKYYVNAMYCEVLPVCAKKKKGC